jgi:sec-independent protein translocase protein TatB
MFGMDFYEIAVIGVVALVVLGPERLPKVARTAGHLFGRLQRYVNGVKADISREMEASEFAKLKQEVQDAAKSFEKSVNEHSNAIEAEAKAIQVDAEKALADKADALPAALPVTAPTPAPTQAEILAAEDAVFAPPSSTIATSKPSTGDASQPILAVEASTASTFGQGTFDFGIEPSRKSAPTQQSARA